MSDKNSGSEMEENVDSMSESDNEMETEETTQLSDEELQARAEKAKTDGNNFYKQKDYKRALQYYTQAIDMCPQCAAYYSNRSATYMMLERYERALEDARASVRIDPKFTKAHMREAKCHLVMGEVAAAVMSYQTVLQLEPNNTVAATELQRANAVQTLVGQGYKCYDEGDFRQVVYCMNKCLEASTECKKFKVLKAECLALLKRYQEAQEIANDMLRSSGMDADAIYVRGMCLYYQDNVDKAFTHFQQVLRLAPDHSKARTFLRKAKSLAQKKEEGNTAFRSRKYEEAHQLYTEALEIDPMNVFTNSKLYNNRATVLCKLGKNEAAIEDCNKAIELDDGYIKAYMRRAKCFTDTEQYEDAVRDYEKIYKLDKSGENKRLVQNAKLELKKSKRKDYYKLLGVGKDASEDEIKKAYKKRALVHHPDRHSGDSEEKKKAEEKLFKECGEAYAVLSDAKKKARYDSGQDLDDDAGFGGFHDIDPNQIFQTFFQSGGMGGFPGQRGGGGMPGGFSFQFG